MENKKLTYEPAELEIIAFNKADIITSSPFDTEEDNF